MTQVHEDFSHVPQSLMQEINREIAADVRREFSRRGLLRNGLIGAGTIMSINLLAACKPREEASDLRDATLPDDAVIPLGPWKISGKSFYRDIALIISQTPITADVATDPATFKQQATVRGKGVGGVLKFWLSASQEKPYEMFREMFEKRGATPVFQPGIGPVVVFQHEHVLDVLERCETFTVDPYAPMMQLATSGHHYPAPAGKAPRGTNAGGHYSHYMLGTDDPKLYVTDSLISRSVVRPDDVRMLRKIVRDICERAVKGVKSGDTFDVITTIGRLSPVLVVAEYIGLPSYAASGVGGEGPWNIDRLRAGMTFPIDQDMKKRFKFQTITEGVVPTHQDIYEWVRDAFRNIFNNFDRNQQFADAGLAASEKLLAWSAKVISVYKGRIAGGTRLGTGNVPDTMITRLIKLQLDAKANPSELAAKFNISEEELRARTGDDRVQVNAFGAFVGAVANPEEANGRIIDGILKLKDGEIQAKNGSYADARRLAMAAAELSSDMSKLNKYAIELLRINPQGEVLLRMTTKDTSIGGVPVRAGTLVFNAHGAAMRDSQVIDDPLVFDIERDPREKVPNIPGESRTGERPQSTVYLHHGYGRHKCLGRYASEMTMEECLRAVLRLGDIERVPGTKFELDKENLYATSLKVKVI